MSLLLRTLSCARSAWSRPPTFNGTKRAFASGSSPAASYRSWVWAAGLGAVGLGASMAVTSSVHLDSEDAPFVVDTATSIQFPKTITVPASVKIPPLSLVGVGVRTVSFLGIKVYSVGFYADLNSPQLKITADMDPEEKVREIVKSTACVVRIMPTRATSYTHLRDAFMRTLQGRLAVAKKEGTITEEQELGAGTPMRKLKSLFPNSPLGKHVPLDMFLSAPVPGQPRFVSFRDLGTVSSDWVATELFLNYFDKNPPSPPLKKSVLEFLENFSN